MYSSDLHIEVVFFQNTVSISLKIALMSEKAKGFACEYRFLDTLFSSISKFYISMIAHLFFGRHTFLARKKVTIVKTVLQWKTRI